MSTNFRIGILGGMGPMAGVFLQKLIVEKTPAECDQDHIQVVCFTNPQVPDRTRSLLSDGGESYFRSIAQSLEVLEGADCSLALIPCNTAHARIEEIRSRTSLKLVNMIELVAQELAVGGYKTVGLLATDGTIRSALYQNAFKAEWMIPEGEDQARVMEIIYSIKAGKLDNAVKLSRLIGLLEKRGAECVVLGCTELSLLFENLKSRARIVDPLRILADEAVRRARAEKK